MKMNGVPGKNTVGNVGDICINTTTNNKYKCTCIYEIIAGTKIRYEYQWELMKDNLVLGNYTIQFNENEDTLDFFI